MAETRNCPRCGSELGHDSSVVLCPLCVSDQAATQKLKPQSSAPGPFDPTLAATHEVTRPRSAKFVRQFGDFELLEEIARGGMGVVYKARQVSLNRLVAVKMILAGQFASSDDVQRFRTEAEAAANLQHPNIVAIYQVGDQDGQHYFSMEYVAGPNLAAVVRDHPLPSRLAAQIVQTVANAVHFAHQHGIIHRDLKPSNVILSLDPLNQPLDADPMADRTSADVLHNAVPKITDFGLAKRVAGGAELTGTNQVLGTPSYMPPECAKGAKAKFGPASDVYSLGAILYELLTSRPPFQAETPLDTLLQAIESEPVRPRLLNTNVPRDLETICIKCLQKNPRDRYPTAAAFADDLSRFLAGDPIQARPPGLVERSARWILKQRRSVATAAVAALVASLALIAATVANVAYQQWQLGYVSINTDGTLLTAEILDPTDQLAVPRFSVPTQEIISLPAGSYDLRLTGPSLLSESYQLFVERAARREFRIPPDRRQLWDPIQVPNTYEVVDFGGHTDLLLLTSTGIRRVNGRTAEDVWKLDLDAAVPHLPRGLNWNWLIEKEQTGRGSLDGRPQLMRPPPDLDGDKVPDLIWCGRHQAFLLAVSGATGEVRWSHLDENLGQAPNQTSTDTYSESAILGRPASGDIDRDGVVDLIVTCASDQRTPPVVNPKRRTIERWVEAVSGRSGKSLWRVELAAGRSVTNIPLASRWPTRRNTWAMGGYTGTSDDGYYQLHWPNLQGAAGFVQVPFAAELTMLGNKAAAVVVAGSTLYCIDPESGKLLFPAKNLGFDSVRPPVLTDLDGDNSPELLVFRGQQRTQGMGRDEVVDLTALSLPTGDKRWNVVLEAAWSGFHWYDIPPTWPIATDLDGDGQQELIVPSQVPTDAQNRIPWGGLRVLDARTGQQRWSTRIRSLNLQIDRFLVGPDIDSDGHRELFTATLVGWPDQAKNFSLFVDALSGRDGHSIWWREVKLGDSYEACEGLGIDPLFWWNTGFDGWPQLAVPYLPNAGDGFPRTFIFSTGTGRLAYTAAGLCDSINADLDGDGVAELLSFRPNHADRYDAGGNLVAVRAAAGDAWQRLGGIWSPAEDLDNDGFSDLVKADDDLTAISGRDGSILWHAKAAADSFKSPPLPLGDFNGDGSPDVLAPYRLGTTSVMGMGLIPLQAISGRTGERLWAADTMTVFAGVQFLEVTDLEKDGRAEVVFVSGMDATSLGSSTWQLWLTVYSAATGEIRWKQPLSDRGKFSSQVHGNYKVHTELADLNNDGVLDLVFHAAPSPPNFDLRAFSGMDGKLLWSHPLIPRQISHNIDIRVSNLSDRDKPTVIVADAPAGRCDVVALNGTSGAMLWRWKATESSKKIVDGTITVSGTSSDKQKRIGVILHRETTDQTSNTELVLLDPLGQVLQRRKIDSPIGRVDQGGNLWCWDVNHDGQQEWLFLDQGKLVVADADLGNNLWQWSLPTDMGEINLRLEHKSPWIVANIINAVSTRMYLLDERTGEIRWTYAGEKAQTWFIHHPHQHQWPLLAVSNEQATSVRRVAQVGSSAPVGQPSEITAVAAVKERSELIEQSGATTVSSKSDATAPLAAVNTSHRRGTQATFVSVDPRLIRRLPWAHMRKGALEVALSMAICLVALILPGSMIVSAVRRGRWSLRRLFAIPVLVAVVIVFFRFLGSEAVDISAYMNGFGGPLMFGWHPTAQVLNSPAWLLVLGLQGFPIVFFLASLIGSFQRRQWKTFLYVISLYGVLIAALVGSMLIYDAGNMDPREHYDWRGAFWCSYPPAFMAGVILLVVGAGRQIWLAMRNKLSSARVARP